MTYDYLQQKPDSKAHFRELYERWEEVRKQSNFQRSPSEDGYERQRRLDMIAEYDAAYRQWIDSFDYNALPA